MKPAPFDYCCPDTVLDAVEILARNPDAKVMAGGQSLMPMMNFRVVKPSLVVDIKRILELDFVEPRDDGGLTVGALTKHRILETSPQVAEAFEVIPQTMRHVAHLAIRNRGTIGGSLSHADPAAELPMLARLLDANIITCSVRGERQIPAEDFFLGALTTDLADDEIIVRVEMPGLEPGVVGSFHEVSRRPGDFALAAVGVLLSLEDDGEHVREIRVAMMGVGETPLRSLLAEEHFLGAALSEQLIEDVVQQACAGLQPRTDLHASGEFRKHLAAIVMKQVVIDAWKKARQRMQQEVQL